LDESNVEEETYSVIFTSLKHPVRRKILRMLAEKPLHFSEIQESLAIDSGHLNYHLDNLCDLVAHLEDGKYALSSIGLAAVKLMSGVEEHQPQARHERLKPRQIVSTVYPLILVGALLIASFFALSYSVQSTSSLSSEQSVPAETHSTNIFIGDTNQTVSFSITTERSPFTGKYNVRVDTEPFSTGYLTPQDSNQRVPVNVGFDPPIKQLTVTQGDIQKLYIGLNVTSGMTGFYGSGILSGNFTISGVGPSLPLVVHGPNGETSNWTPQWKTDSKTTDYFVPTSIDVTTPGKYEFDISYGAGGIVGWNGYMTLNAEWQFLERPYFYYGIAGLTIALGYLAFVIVDRVQTAKRKVPNA
jgi:DNA-binding transcriptional ArsR family regulator